LEIAREVAGRGKKTAAPSVHPFLEGFIEYCRRETFAETLEFYIASFSRVPNDLGQWRAYADNGRGFAIGFFPRLFEVVEPWPSDKPKEFVGAVKYPNFEDAVVHYTPPILEATKVLFEASTNADFVKHSQRRWMPNGL
jgi:hypothetical protein